jgi:hypothetical protein
VICRAVKFDRQNSYLYSVYLLRWNLSPLAGMFTQRLP